MKVHIGVLHHKHGVDVFVGRTKREVYADVYDYVKEWWDDFCKGQPLPRGCKAAMEAYFEASEASGGSGYLDMSSGTVKCVCGK